MAELQINFVEQIKVTRKSIQDSFKKSHEALRVRESNLLSRVDEIEKEYNSKTQEMKELLESLNKAKSLNADTLSPNKLTETFEIIRSTIDNKIAELTADIDSSIEFEWDNLFETGIEQLGSIKLNGQAPVILGPSMFNAEPTNLSTNLFNKQTNVFSPNQKSTFSATGNTPQTPTAPFAFAGTPLPNQQNTPTTPQTPTYANYNIGSNQPSSDLSKQVIKTAKRRLPHK